jgi:hypothetical protein
MLLASTFRDLGLVGCAAGCCAGFWSHAAVLPGCRSGQAGFHGSLAGGWGDRARCPSGRGRRGQLRALVMRADQGEQAQLRAGLRRSLPAMTRRPAASRGRPSGPVSSATQARRASRRPRHRLASTPGPGTWRTASSIAGTVTGDLTEYCRWRRCSQASTCAPRGRRCGSAARRGRELGERQPGPPPAPGPVAKKLPGSAARAPRMARSDRTDERPGH